MIFMIIESVIGLVVIGTVVYLLSQIMKSESGTTDLNKDGKTDIKDAAEALNRAVDQVIEKVDVNQDGKVNVKDAEAVAEKVKEKFKKNVTESEKAKAVVEAAPVATETKPPKRARNKGKLVGDNPATPDVNEAWEGGKAPAKKEKDPAKKKPRKPKMTVVK